MSIIDGPDSKYRDRVAIVYQILLKSHYPLPSKRLAQSSNLHYYHFKKYRETLLEKGMLKKVEPPRGYKTKRHTYQLQNTSKGREVLGQIRKLYKLFDIQLEKPE